MGFPILVRRHLYIESGPWSLEARFCPKRCHQLHHVSNQSSSPCCPTKYLSLQIIYKMYELYTNVAFLSKTNNIPKLMVEQLGPNSCEYSSKFGYGIDQWEKVLHSNASSHWLSPYPEWTNEVGIEPSKINLSRIHVHSNASSHWLSPYPEWTNEVGIEPSKINLSRIHVTAI